MGIWSRTKERIGSIGVRDTHDGKNWREVNAERVDRMRVEASSERAIRQERRTQRSEDRTQRRELERLAYREAFHQGRIERAKSAGRQMGRSGGMSMIPPMQQRQRTHQQSKKGHGKFIWDSPFVSSYKSPKPVHKQRYAVVGGKAYPVVGMGRKPHKPKNKTSSRDPVQAFMKNIGR